jgi:hypothetical protein
LELLGRKQEMRIKKNLLWIKGYLATLTAADETQLAGAQAQEPDG